MKQKLSELHISKSCNEKKTCYCKSKVNPDIDIRWLSWIVLIFILLSLHCPSSIHKENNKVNKERNEQFVNNLWLDVVPLESNNVFDNVMREQIHVVSLTQFVQKWFSFFFCEDPVKLYSFDLNSLHVLLFFLFFLELFDTHSYLNILLWNFVWILILRGRKLIVSLTQLHAI